MSGRTAGDPIRVGLLGCGTVGTGVLRILRDNAADIEARLGVPIVVVGIAVADTAKSRDPVVLQSKLTTDAMSLIDNPAVDVVVEVIGGYEPARTYLLAALERGKHVVTANKALLARHGTELFLKADDVQRDVIFEASVGGGIPIIRTLREGLASDRIDTIHGIINGTSNYILTAMALEGRSYEAALLDAQKLGYAEADPTMDCGGIDAAQKLSILISVSYGAQIPFDQITTDGIESVTDLDMRFAKAFGYTIKPLAVARAYSDGIEARVHPALIPSDSMLGSVNGVFNAVRVQSHALGPVLFYGQGAGMMPTAAAVVSDIIELGRNVRRGTSGRLPHLAFHADLVETRGFRPRAQNRCPFYLRFSVEDRPGVLAAIAGVLGERSISISQLIQEDAKAGRPVQVVMLTHVVTEGDVMAALATIDAMPFALAPTRYLRVEDVR